MIDVDRERLIFKNVDIWMRYVDGLPTPNDDVDRVYNHYLCTILFDSKKKTLIKNIVSFPTLLICLFLTVLNSITNKQKLVKQYDAVQFIVRENNNSSSAKLGLPKELIEEYKSRVVYDRQKRKTLLCTGYLDLYSIKFWLNLCKYKDQIFMNFSMLMHLSAINKIIYMYRPRCIITTESENDFTTSVTTSFCESLGVEYIGIMHGENFVNPMHTNVRFSRFYVWDEKYIEQYVRTGSSREFFRVFEPDRAHFKIASGSVYKYDIAYYLQGQTEEQLQSICETLISLIRNGLKCKIRLHPRATDKKLVLKVFENTNIDIETADMISAEDSYSESKYIVSMYSTVLTDAFYNGYKAVIDDVSDRELYKNLEKMKYINLDRISLRLSELLVRFEEK